MFIKNMLTVKLLNGKLINGKLLNGEEFTGKVFAGKVLANKKICILLLSILLLICSALPDIALAVRADRPQNDFLPKVPAAASEYPRGGQFTKGGQNNFGKPSLRSPGKDTGQKFYADGSSSDDHRIQSQYVRFLCNILTTERISHEQISHEQINSEPINDANLGATFGMDGEAGKTTIDSATGHAAGAHAASAPFRAKPLRRRDRDNETQDMLIQFSPLKILSGDLPSDTNQLQMKVDSKAIEQKLKSAIDPTGNKMAGLLKVNTEDFRPHPGSVCLPSPPSCGLALITISYPEYRITSCNGLPEKVSAILQNSKYLNGRKSLMPATENPAAASPAVDSPAAETPSSEFTSELKILKSIRKDFYCNELEIQDFNGDGLPELAMKIRDSIKFIDRDMNPVSRDSLENASGRTIQINWMEKNNSNKNSDNKSNDSSENLIVDGFLILGDGRTVEPNVSNFWKADLDGDGVREIIIAQTNPTISCVGPTLVRIFSQNGEKIWTHTFPTWISCIATGDITGDSAEEIIFSLHYTDPIVIVGKE
ncbi:MAG: hypothetical protein CVV64_19620 [Candidatus Wallbacteria bacterium HGW-Wallbacteria-1]|jgi:hypothetical protein|uniref:VCBS repeat-containing protein n=1 Tax=Candidatus Wallbacteria bacterium HGW-Wallbacteria-1 TaxID=2013854 RepID=A0A2N1PIW3_9BACT|nr:MAG: hypothetical protein CVV64_19620 [Candidatus Wallbacteria bacterium HGW-Wallbacteria-1]